MFLVTFVPKKREIQEFVKFVEMVVTLVYKKLEVVAIWDF
jgi:hypothetical protein